MRRARGPLFARLQAVLSVRVEGDHLYVEAVLTVGDLLQRLHDALHVAFEAKLGGRVRRQRNQRCRVFTAVLSGQKFKLWAHGGHERAAERVKARLLAARAPPEPARTTAGSPLATFRRARARSDIDFGELDNARARACVLGKRAQAPADDNVVHPPRDRCRARAPRRPRRELAVGCRVRGHTPPQTTRTSRTPRGWPRTCTSA
mmetsp:Transcript_5950/g.23546  ORF Transcript_5950/g.23546 Transcript_5950/m.23546 type:complete len:204 (+) Transcript_5950:1649-2260(+)